MSDEVVIPDVFGAIPGWRIWILKQGRLFSVWGDHDVWPLRIEKVAKCLDGEPHESPDLDCSCGIYAYKNRSHVDHVANDYDFARRLTNPDKERYYVFGEVLLWGAMIPAEHGWRAQYCYPQRVYLPYMAVNQAAVLKANYGIHIKLEPLTKHKPRGWR